MKFGISLKSTLFILSLISIIVASLVYLHYQMEKNFFEKEYSEKIKTLAISLENGISSYNQLEDKEWLYSYLVRFIYIYNENDILFTNIDLAENGKLMVVASTDYGSIGSTANHYSYLAYNSEKTIIRSINDNGSSILWAVRPFYLSGEKVGTIEIAMSMDKAYGELGIMLGNSLLLAGIISLFLTIVSIYIFRKLFVIPILTLRDTALKIGKGNLDINIDAKSKDEIGELFIAFREMSNNLRESRRNIDNYNKKLEEMIEDKTEELHKKIEELERYKKVTVGRELKMIELKKEIKELQSKLTEADR